MPFVDINVTKIQLFHYYNEDIEIIKPYIGSQLYRINKKTETCECFVVINISTKKNGKNKGLIDKITLCSKIDDSGERIEYDPQKKIILRLNNHGKWWNSSLRKEYRFSWNSIK